MHSLLVELRREEFDVSTATVNALLMLHTELDDEWLAQVAEVIKTCRHGIETGILARLQTCSANSVTIAAWDCKTVQSVHRGSTFAHVSVNPFDQLCYLEHQSVLSLSPPKANIRAHVQYQKLFRTLL